MAAGSIAFAPSVVPDSEEEEPPPPPPPPPPPLSSPHAATKTPHISAAHTIRIKRFVTNPPRSYVIEDCEIMPFVAVSAPRSSRPGSRRGGGAVVPRTTSSKHNCWRNS